MLSSAVSLLFSSGTFAGIDNAELVGSMSAIVINAVTFESCTVSWRGR